MLHWLSKWQIQTKPQHNKLIHLSLQKKSNQQKKITLLFSRTISLQSFRNKLCWSVDWWSNDWLDFFTCVRFVICIKAILLMVNPMIYFYSKKWVYLHFLQIMIIFLINWWKMCILLSWVASIFCKEEKMSSHFLSFKSHVTKIECLIVFNKLRR